MSQFPLNSQSHAPCSVGCFCCNRLNCRLTGKADGRSRDVVCDGICALPLVAASHKTINVLRACKGILLSLPPDHSSLSRREAIALREVSEWLAG